MKGYRVRKNKALAKISSIHHYYLNEEKIKEEETLISLKNFSFRYREEEKDVLKNINL